MTMIPQLPSAIETRRLTIRPFAPDDAGALYEAVDQSRERVGRWLPWVRFYTDQSAADAFIAACGQHWRDATELPFGIFERESGRFLGGIAVHATKLGHPIRWDWRIFETGYWLREGAEGQGYMREATRAIVRFTFQQLGAHKLALRCDSRNDASRKVAESTGFQRDRTGRHDAIATDGTVRDSLYFSLITEEAEQLISAWGDEPYRLILPDRWEERRFEPPTESTPPTLNVAPDRPDRIETERLFIRPATVDDAPLLFAAIDRSRAELEPWIRFARRIHSVEDAATFCAQSERDAASFHRFDLHAFEKASGTFVGGGTFHNMNWELPSVELGWWLDSAQTGRGYGQEIVAGLLGFVVDRWRVDRVEAWCHVANLASRRLALRSGLIEEGIVRREYPDLSGFPADWAVFSQISTDRG